MSNNIKDKIKTIIIIALLVLLIICSTIFITIVLFQNDRTINENNNEGNNYIDESINNTIENNIIESNILIFEEITDITEEEKKLITINDNKTYMLIKECMQNYYVDSQFCIDEIYEEKIDSTKVLYNIYYRLEDSIKKVVNLNMFIKFDKKNKTYKIYPYDFIQNNKMLNMKEGDKINFDEINKEIEANEDNEYDENEISTDNEAYMIELFKRYKFDLILDTEKIYNQLDQNYKNERFKTFEEFKKYIYENAEELKSDKINKYKVYNLSEYTQYIGISDKERHYIFNAKNLMDYTLILDNYSVDTPEYIGIYASNMPSVRAKYCIDRVRKAINDKNYEYVYEKLNIAQKHNFYKNYDDFEKFITNEFFEKNTFIIGDYTMISNNAFQYTVAVKDSTLKNEEVKIFTMTVIIEEGTDFYIGIVK